MAGWVVLCMEAMGDTAEWAMEEWAMEEWAMEEWAMEEWVILMIQTV